MSKKGHTMVFVYGTLMRDRPLNGWLRTSKFVADAVLWDHSLISFGVYPALIALSDESESNYRVIGELWEVPNKVFSQLKSMEESVGYEAVDVDVETDDGYVEAKAFRFASIEARDCCWEQEDSGYTKIKNGKVSFVDSL